MSLLLFAMRARTVVCLPAPSLCESVFFFCGHDPALFSREKEKVLYACVLLLSNTRYWNLLIYSLNNLLLEGNQQKTVSIDLQHLVVVVVVVAIPLSRFAR